MQCVICYEKKWVLVPDCKHVICISCLLKIKKMNVLVVEKNYLLLFQNT